MRRLAVTLLVLVMALAAASAAQAVVVSDQGVTAGVALVQGTGSQLGSVGVTTVTSGGPCTDPWLSSDLQIASYGLCWHSGGAVMHNNEPFALTWDLPTPNRRYWETTRSYLQQFLRDVADSSGSLGSPYAVTPQYRDSAGRANDSSAYGGGCIDLGASGGFTCDFGDSTGSGTGHDYPASTCKPSGSDPVHLGHDGGVGSAANDTCLTDAQIQAEVSAASGQLNGHGKPGYSPLVVVLTPPGVVDCLDSPGASSPGKLCSANATPAPPTPTLSTASTGGTVTAGIYEVEITYQTPSGETPPSGVQFITAVDPTSTITVKAPPQESGATGWYIYVSQGGAFSRQGALQSMNQDFTLSAPPSSGAAPPTPVPSFCSYHSQVNGLPYVVVPWTPLTPCDEPDVPVIDLSNLPDVAKLAEYVGTRLVSPLSQAHMAAITNPMLNGWTALDGSEVNDNNGCRALDKQRDKVSVGSSAQNPYYLQREWNNAAAIESDPNALGCTPNVVLTPRFVIPSAINAGDLVELDGSTTASTLIVPKANYHWDFGDGSSAVGPSVSHSYAKGGNYTVTLTVTDRGGNIRSLAQTLDVLGRNGQVVAPQGSSGGFQATLQLLPQGLRSLLRKGLAMRVTSSESAAGIATLLISRGAAQRAHIKLGHGASVVIGRGKLSSIGKGTISLRVHIAPSIARKLRQLRHLTLTVRLALTGADHGHVTVDAAGRY